ncbi:MAG: hypothetical protein A2748_00355 [Candidatus Wildermuthbacteria bacterium RIFCSPHIGHO2_01_FULL_45_20]|nr:MAG: hypothetical protein A2748_00355 [Candidatus Wildermuthbacteria bacterium RIFCSPHIGHO2_01_FULL_45_20]
MVTVTMSHPKQHVSRAVLEEATRILYQGKPLSGLQEMRLVVAMQRANPELSVEGWADATFPVKNFRILAMNGLMGLTVPQRYGGMGASLVEHMEALYELALYKPGVALAYCMSTTACAILASVAPESLKAQILPQAARGAFISSATSEPGLTLQAAGSQMKAVYSPVPGGYRYRAEKWFCSGASNAQEFSAMGRVEGTNELMLAIIPAGKEVRIVRRWADGDPLAMRETGSDTVEFANVFVPDEMVVCRGRSFLPEFRRFACGYAVIYGAIGSAALQYVEGILAEDEQKAERFQSQVQQMTMLVIASEQAWMAAAEALERNDSLAAIKIAQAKLTCVENSLSVLKIAMGIEGGVSILAARSPLANSWRQIAVGIVQPPSTDRCQWVLDEYNGGRGIRSLLEII